MKLDIINIEGKSAGKKADLNDAVFAIGEPSEHLVWQDVRLIQARSRQGTAKTKERNEVIGSKKKPYRQKGTGNARAGDKRSPLWRKGGTIFGPKPRDYGFKMNKKARAKARASALTYKASESRIKVIQDFSLEEPKTKKFVEILNNLELTDNKVLFVVAGEANNVYLSGRNIPKTKIIRAEDINTLDITHADDLVLMESSVEIIEKNILKN